MFISIKRQEHLSSLQDISMTRYMADGGLVKPKGLCIKTELWKSYFTMANLSITSLLIFLYFECSYSSSGIYNFSSESLKYKAVTKN